jgi:hypothetical protein
MNKSQISLLSESELLLVRATEPAELKLLDEDEAGELLLRVRRARNKYSKNYRRQSTQRVAAKRSRGSARGSSNKTAMKAEIFEDALARVSRRLSLLAKQSAADLRRERLDAARGERPAGSAARGTKSAAAKAGSTTAKGRKTSATRTPASVKRVRSSQAAGARRQAKRDSR